MKSDEDRGPFGAWAYHTREALDPLTVEQVAKALSYSAPSIRKVEGGSAAPSRRMLRDLPAYYREVAAERGIPIAAPPGESSPGTSPSADVAALVSRLDRLVAALEDSTRVNAATLQALDAAVRVLAGDRLAPAEPIGSGEGR